MTKSGVFSRFTIRTDAAGRACAVFHLLVPEWRTEWMPMVPAVPSQDPRASLDAASLEAKIVNLARHGLDRSMSAAALQALLAAQDKVQAVPPAVAAFSLPPWPRPSATSSW